MHLMGLALAKCTTGLTGRPLLRPVLVSRSRGVRSCLFARKRAALKSGIVNVVLAPLFTDKPLGLMQFIKGTNETHRGD